jgi:hypothetical protein
MAKDQEFTKYLEKIEDPNYQGYVNQSLPENPTDLEETKFNFCQTILAYQQDNNLSDEELAKRLALSIPETKEILFCYINNFTLDRLIGYVSKIFFPSKVKIYID